MVLYQDLAKAFRTRPAGSRAWESLSVPVNPHSHHPKLEVRSWLMSIRPWDEHDRIR